ncbi:MAG TPA: hypothetical protein VMT15_02010 [Bryobacteraceae bacterium]|nr:hypothetical protein [Bryobacteraceae bacterium]
MNAILFGASGMVGQGVLRECLLDPGIEKILSIGRSATGQTNPKLTEVLHRDIADLTPIRDRLSGYDACFFCLGVSSVGMKEADYRHVTYDYAVGAARTLAELNPGMTFCFISGAGTDSAGRQMWARVKGETENALLQMPFKAAYMFRPGFIQPLHGIQSKTALYRILYKILAPLNPLLLKYLPKYATTSEILGRAMIKAARQGAPKRVLESADINALLAHRRST